MPQYHPNGGATDAHVQVIALPGSRRGDHFGSGDQVAAALGSKASNNRNGGRRPLPPVRR